jgi:hypothetical protein
MHKVTQEGLEYVSLNVEHDACGTVIPQGDTGLGSGTRREVWGEDLPHFHARKRRGELLPATNWREEDFSLVASRGGEVHAVAMPCDRWYGSAQAVAWSAFQGHGQELPNNAELLAQRAMDKLYRGKAFDLYTFWGERHDLTRTYRDIVRNARDLWNRTKRAGIKPENRVLDYAYGWRQIVRSIEDIITVGERYRDAPRDFWRAKAELGTTLIDKSTEVPLSVGSMYYLTHATLQKATYNERVTVVSRITPPLVLIDPVTGSWELLRFSFILDKIVDVGSWLGALMGSVWFHDAVFAYGTKLAYTEQHNISFDHAGSFDGNVFETATYNEYVTTRSPSSPSFVRPQFSLQLPTTELSYWVELARELTDRNRR